MKRNERKTQFNFLFIIIVTTLYLSYHAQDMAVSKCGPWEFTDMRKTI